MKDAETPAASKEELLLDYIGYYEESWLQGKLVPCNEEGVKERAKQLLKPASCSWAEWSGAELYTSIETCLLMNKDRERETLKDLINAFTFLEIVCVNLFLSPWRKEIKSLKTFTGSFVYNVRSVLPENVVSGILEKIGYTAKTATEFQVTGKINTKETQHFAFQIFLARIECELILGMSNEGETCTFLKLLQKRATIFGNCDESRDREKETLLQEEPGNFANSKKQQIITYSISQQSSVSKDGLASRVRDSKRTDHSESGDNRRLDMKGMYQSKANADKSLDSKGIYHTEPSAGKSSRKVTNDSEPLEDRRDSKEQNHSETVEATNMDSKALKHFKSTADRNIASSGEYHSKSTEDTRMNSRGAYHSESPENKINGPGTFHSDSSSESRVPIATSQDIDTILESKNQATECFHSKRSESEEFLTQYSDLNIAQKPIFQEACPTKYKEPTKKKRETGLAATVLEELPITEANPPRFNETGPQSFVICNEAKAENRRPTNKSRANEKTCDFATSKIYIPINPLNIESNEVKQEHDPLSCNIPVVQPDVSNEVECELSSSFSKLNIVETVEEKLTYPVEETTKHESEALESRPTINSKNAGHEQIHILNPSCDHAEKNNGAEGRHPLLRTVSKITECTEGATSESIKRPLIERTTAEGPSENFRHVREPPHSIYVPPQSLESQQLSDNYSSMHFNFQPKEQEERARSENTVPVGDSVFQVKESGKEDFVIISHHVTPKD